MAKPKKPKAYAGNVQFDVWGNLAEYDNSKYKGKIQLTDDNFENGQIVWDQWDQTQRKYVKVPIFYTADEMEFVPYDTPKSNWGNIMYIGEMNNHFSMPNFEFTDTLEYDDYGSSQYSKHFIMKSQTNGRSYRVFIRDLKSFIDIMDKGVVTGKFTFCKRGEKYGLKPVV